MSYNPLEQEFQARCAEKDALQEFVQFRKKSMVEITERISILIKRLGHESRWFNKTDLKDKLFQLNEESQHLADLEFLLRNHDRLLIDQKSSQIEITRLKKTAFNPINWFSGTQKELRKKLKRLILEEKMLLVERQKLDDEMNKRKGSIYRLDSDIKRYRSYDEFCLTQNNEISELKLRNSALDDSVKKAKAYISEFVQDIDGFHDRKNDLDTVLAPLIGKINEFYKKIEIVRNIVQFATELDERLAQAKSSNERNGYLRMCQKSFGTENPGNVVDQQLEVLRRLDEDLLNLHNKIIQMANTQFD